MANNAQMFSNEPMFCDKNLTLQGVLNMRNFQMAVEANPATSSQPRCGDKLLGELSMKNILHEEIRCSGSPISINFMEEIFPSISRQGPRSETKRWYSRYVCEKDLNIYFGATARGTAPGVGFWATLLKSNHGQQGRLSNVSKGVLILDKDYHTIYTVGEVDTATDYAHRMFLIPNDGAVTGIVRANTPYLVVPANLVGGCSCPNDMTAMSSQGYLRETTPVKIRRDWRLCIDTLTGWEDQFRFGIMYDTEGNPYDAIDTYQAVMMREGIQMAKNILAFSGSPTTNELLLSGVDARIDSTHKGFYGLMPTLLYGGGTVYDIREDIGFDFEADGEPLFLYQDSRKQSKRFLGWHGMAFDFTKTTNANKMVERNQPEGMWENFRRLGGTDAEMKTNLAKLGVRSYTYNGFNLDFKRAEAWSDRRYMGSDKLSATCILIPEDGATENGRQIPALEFNTYGNDQWNSNYEEFFVDERKTTRCEFLSGYATEAFAMTVHCPDKFILLNPVKAA